MSPRRMLPGVGLLERGDRAHERRLAGAVRAEQAEHAGGDLERDVVEGADAVGVRLGETIDDEVHECCGYEDFFVRPDRWPRVDIAPPLKVVLNAARSALCPLTKKRTAAGYSRRRNTEFPREKFPVSYSVAAFSANPG